MYRCTYIVHTAAEYVRKTRCRYVVASHFPIGGERERRINRRRKSRFPTVLYTVRTRLRLQRGKGKNGQNIVRL